MIKLLCSFTFCHVFASRNIIFMQKQDLVHIMPANVTEKLTGSVTRTLTGSMHLQRRICTSPSTKRWNGFRTNNLINFKERI